MNTKGKILIVDDEPGILKVISHLLMAEGYSLVTAESGSSGLALALVERPDLIVLDLMLPEISGFEVCKSLRQVGFAGAILMLTARGEVEDRVKGLQIGADDYLAKPVNLDELLARIEALLRRSGIKNNQAEANVSVGDISLDFSTSTFTKGGEAIRLTTKEVELLHLLVKNRGSVVSRDTILEKVWKESSFVSPRTVDVHIAWIRQKIETYPDKPRLIATIRGEGYRFCG